MATEKRLIDANDMKTEFREWFDHNDYRTMNELIDDVPTVDAVEVVRCKDCKQWGRSVGFADSPNGNCFYHDIYTNGHDFCSYGERKDNV